MGQCKILVIFGIATGGNGFCYPHDLGLAKKRHQEVNAFILMNLLCKPRTSQHIVQLSDDRLG